MSPLRRFALWLERVTRPPHDWTPKEWSYIEARRDQWMAAIQRYCDAPDTETPQG